MTVPEWNADGTITALDGKVWTREDVAALSADDPPLPPPPGYSDGGTVEGDGGWTDDYGSYDSDDDCDADW